MKIEKLLNSIEALKELSQLKFENGAISFRLGKLLNEIQPVVNLALEQQKELFNEYKDQPEIFKEKLKPTLNEEIDINIPEIKLSDFKKGDDWLEVSPASYAVLDWLIIDES